LGNFLNRIPRLWINRIKKIIYMIDDQFHKLKISANA